MIIDGQKMLNIFVFFGEYIFKVTFTLFMFDVNEFLANSFSNSVIKNCYMSETFDCS